LPTRFGSGPSFQRWQRPHVADHDDQGTRRAGQSRLIVPTIYRDDYIGGLKALVRATNFTAPPLVRALLECQRITNAIVSPDLDRTIELWPRHTLSLKTSRPPG